MVGEPALLIPLPTQGNPRSSLDEPWCQGERRGLRVAAHTAGTRQKPGKLRSLTVGRCASVPSLASSQSLFLPLLLFPAVARKRRFRADCYLLAWRDGRPEEESSPGGAAEERRGSPARGCCPTGAAAGSWAVGRAGPGRLPLGGGCAGVLAPRSARDGRPLPGGHGAPRQRGRDGSFPRSR